MVGSNIKHLLVSAKSDGADATLVQPGDWNDPHVGGVEIIDRDMTDVEAANTTTETSLYSHAIAANRLGTTGGFRLHIGGNYFNNDGAARTLTLRFKLGGSTVATSNAMSLTNGSSDREWHLIVVCMNLTATTQIWGGMGLIGPIGADFFWADSSATQMLIAGLRFASSIDTTVSATLDFTVQHGTAAANIDIDKKLAVLELIPPV